VGEEEEKTKSPKCATNWCLSSLGHTRFLSSLNSRFPYGKRYHKWLKLTRTSVCWKLILKSNSSSSNNGDSDKYTTGIKYVGPPMPCPMCHYEFMTQLDPTVRWSTISLVFEPEHPNHFPETIVLHCESCHNIQSFWVQTLDK
jgi:hypothetical protein